MIGVILVLREAEVIGAILEAKDLEDMAVKKEKKENCNAAIVTIKNKATVFLTKSGCFCMSVQLSYDQNLITYGWIGISFFNVIVKKLQ